MWARVHAGIAMEGWLECQALFNLMPVCWDSEQVNLSVCPVRVDSVFYSPLAFLVLSPAGFQNQLGGSCLSCTDPRARVPKVDSNLSLLREDLQV